MGRISRLAAPTSRRATARSKGERPETLFRDFHHGGPKTQSPIKWLVGVANPWRCKQPVTVQAYRGEERVSPYDALCTTTCDTYNMSAPQP